MGTTLSVCKEVAQPTEFESCELHILIPSYVREEKRFQIANPFVLLHAVTTCCLRVRDQRSTEAVSMQTVIIQNLCTCFQRRSSVDDVSGE
jgi:hypothetical protein